MSMDILVLQETDWKQRGPHQQHHFFERLADRGHDVRVIDFEFLWSGDESIARGREVETPQPRVVDGTDVTLIRPPMVKAPVLDKISIVPAHGREILRQLRPSEPDVVVALGILNASIGLHLANFHDVPFVYYIIDNLHTLLENPVYSLVAKQLESHVASRADYVYVINDGLREYAIELGADPEQVSIFPGGVDVSMYQSGDSDAVSLDAQIGSDETVLCFMGWLYEFSGLVDLANALADADGYDDVRLLVIGDGDLLSDLERLRDDRLGDQLILTGRVPFEDVPDYLNYADVCLLPSEHNDIMDGIVPIKMYEYLASGSPVVSTPLPGVRQEFGDDNGVVYASSPEAVLERAVELDRTGTARRHAEQGAAFVEAYDWSALTEDFESHLQQVTDTTGN